MPDRNYSVENMSDYSAVRRRAEKYASISGNEPEEESCSRPRVLCLHILYILYAFWGQNVLSMLDNDFTFIKILPSFINRKVQSIKTIVSD
jgi:hypothetical protein